MDRLPFEMRSPEDDKPVKTGKQGLAAEFSHQLTTGAAIPRDPKIAGTVGHRKATYSVAGDPDGNRAERRAAARRRRPRDPHAAAQIAAAARAGAAGHRKPPQG